MAQLVAVVATEIMQSKAAMLQHEHPDFIVAADQVGNTAIDGFELSRSGLTEDSLGCGTLFGSVNCLHGEAPVRESTIISSSSWTAPRREVRRALPLRTEASLFSFGSGKVPSSHVALEVALETKPNLLLLTEEADGSLTSSPPAIVYERSMGCSCTVVPGQVDDHRTSLRELVSDIADVGNLGP